VKRIVQRGRYASTWVVAGHDVIGVTPKALVVGFGHAGIVVARYHPGSSAEGEISFAASAPSVPRPAWRHGLALGRRDRPPEEEQVDRAEWVASSGRPLQTQVDSLKNRLKQAPPEARMKGARCAERSSA